MNHEPEDLWVNYAWPNIPWVRINLVVDSQGEIRGSDGTSNPLSSKTDREILKTIRRDAEIIIVGANSVRSEGWHLPPNGTLGIVSRTRHVLETCPDPERVIVGSLDEILDHSSKFQRVLCEGGKFVAGELLARDFADEICLTINLSDVAEEPKLPTWMSAVSPRMWTLHRAIGDDAQAFTIWRRATSEPL